MTKPEEQDKKHELEEMFKDLSEYIQKKFGNRPVFNVAPFPAPEAPRPKSAKNGFQLKFDHTPRRIKEYLDRFVIKQDEAKKVLAIAVCDHYNHALADLEKRADYEYTKQNVIMLGPTGVGKTYLIKCIARLIGVPFVKADATKYSETGYVGRNVEDMIRELVQQADGDIQAAQYGIIYIDEVDKIASMINVSGRDVSGAGVQRNLLKLMEEAEIPLRDPMDISAQMEAVLEFQQKGKVQPKYIDTRHILFIVSGAFDELAEIVKKRLSGRAIGFGAEIEGKKEKFQYLMLAQSRDFIQYGLEPEFIGRLPVRVACEELNEDDLYQILVRSEGSIIKQYRASFRAWGTEAAFAPDGLREIARLAGKEETGARGLITVCEKILRDFKYELPEKGIDSFKIDRALVNRPAEALKKLLKKTVPPRTRASRQALACVEEEFKKEHDLQIVFSGPAARTASRLARGQKIGLEEFCRQVLKDFPYGLKLIRQNSGQKEFVITPEALEKPAETLSRWIMESFRPQT